MISASLLALFALLGVIIAAIVGIAAVIFLLIFKKGLDLKITTKDPPNNPPTT